MFEHFLRSWLAVISAATYILLLFRCCDPWVTISKVMSSACCGSIVELMESSVMSSSTWHSGMLIEFLDISKDEWMWSSVESRVLSWSGSSALTSLVLQWLQFQSKGSVLFTTWRYCSLDTPINEQNKVISLIVFSYVLKAIMNAVDFFY